MKCNLILSFYISMLWVSHTASSQFQNPVNGGGDLQALLSIKAQIFEDPFGILGSWNNFFHFCNWTGVSCNLTQQRVLGLNLSEYQLRGTLSPSIGNLTFLKNLNLEKNTFFGSIPQTVSQLYHLQHLLLSNNSFVGGIPRNLSYSLEIISLDRNLLTGTIPDEVGSLSNLLELGISLNYLSGRIPPTLGNLSALEGLFLSFNNFKGIIPQEFGKLYSLMYLDLSSNQLTGAYPLMLHNITSLINIMLAKNMLNGSLPLDIGLYLPNLQKFYIGNNQFTGPIPDSISNASVMTFLDISFNAFSGQVPMDLGRIKRLNRLDLSFNLFGGTKRDSLKFINSLTNCSNLGVLHLHFNRLWGVLPTSIANLSTMLTSLTSLRLNGNNISGGIPDGLDNLNSLGRLDLSQNSLTGTIPASIVKLTNLQGLNLSNNVFSGGIPFSLGNLTLLSVLEMQRNMLSGVIPASLSNCKRLQVLDLSHNTLTNDIPLSIFQMSSLTYLILAHNLLSGYLPLEVGDWIMLTRFDVSDNLLTGALPPALGSCISLEFLSAQGNSFNGSIPSSLGQLRVIQFLDLSRNHLVGQIPVGFSAFLFMNFLNLSFNSLEGKVPSKGLFRNSTSFSIAGNEKLCGGIKSLHLSECKLKFSMVMVLPAISVVIFISIVYICCFYNQPTREPMNSPLGDQFPKLSYTKLHQASDGFSAANLIGMGRYSRVYKVNLTGYEQGIAVKVIKLDQNGSIRSFVAECEALKHIRHRNLVKIITSCSGTDFKGNEFKALVYALMSNGNLDSWLHPLPTESKNLDLIQRLSVAIDVASALFYLHHECEVPFVHRDIKPSNILLDDELGAHLGDFGSARSLLDSAPARRRIYSSTHVFVGTAGYIALECAIGVPVARPVDVYSYGILLLEMFSGKRPTDSIFKDEFSLHNYVKMAIPDQVMSIADPRLLVECVNNRALRISGEFEKCLASVFQVGVMCSVQLPRERMETADALMKLRTIREKLSRII